MAPAAGTVTMWDADRTPVIEFTLQRCLPVRMRAPALNAREGLVAVEELALVYETMSVALPGAGGAGAGLSAPAGMSASPPGGTSASAPAGITGSASPGVSVSGGASL